MENGAKVKLRGVQVGEVTSIGAETGGWDDLSKLNLKMDPGPFQYLPSNVEAEIKSSTAFGAKYVDLIVPADAPAPSRSSRASVLHSRNVTVEVNTVFENLQAVVQLHRPGEAELGAVSGGRIGARQGRSSSVRRSPTRTTCCSP